ncbi:uncharacterized protein MP3633_3490 [Marinomonas primoryensis]|uniref:Uncharacterized protein n=1 Tax=Marinomonas primoryensis TaxID=178399 RepID=A0A859D0A0_9GAMM|nr:uncharacterized protein MP3633_3490 [Marinomonas primoryensis]
MTTGKSDKKCSFCDGTGVNKSNIQDLGEPNDSTVIQYQPIECQHCKGSGKE